MANLLYCVKYKNYYNRERRGLDLVSGYTDYDPNYYVQEDINNFNYGDGVSTTQTVDKNVDDKDYAILTDELDNIIGRYYILECKYSRYDQYVLTLFRDLLYDYKEELSQATCFIEKGTLTVDNPLIYNKEQMTVNQIKKKEIDLNDKTRTPWIVMYVDKTTAFSGSITPDASVIDMSTQAHTAWTHYNKTYFGPAKGMALRFELRRPNATFLDYSRDYDGISSCTNDERVIIHSSYVNIGSGKASEIPYKYLFFLSNYMETFKNDLHTESGVNLKTDTDISEIIGYDNTYIKFQDGTYKVSITTGDYESATWRQATENGALDLSFNSALIANGLSQHGTPLTFKYKSRQYQVVMEQVQLATFTYTIPASRRHTADAPYDIVCMPYNNKFNTQYVISGQTYITANDTSVAMAVAMDIAKNGTGASPTVYDIQLLPYCPLEINTNTLNLDTIAPGEGQPNTYSPVVQSNVSTNYASVILYAPSQSFVKNITLTSAVQEKLLVSHLADEKKAQVQCDFIRFCSPNYNGVFEMGIAQNEGISNIQAKCTYLPYNPYIHIAPEFKGLYGTSYKDNRGLICGGSFSLPIMSDAWASYERQNANYQNIFDREVESIELKDKYSRISDVIGVGTGALNAAGTGAIAGSAYGPIGAGIGAGASAAISAGLGIADIAINEQLRNDSLDLKKDMFGYQLGNIQALPKSLSRTTSYNIDSKYFPFIEYYTCTDTERNAFKKKIEWDGMSVGVIGYIDDYRPSGLGNVGFVKGQIIRCPSIGDYHVLNALSNELSKGVYI